MTFSDADFLGALRVKLQSKFSAARVIFPCPCAVYMYKIMILLNSAFENTLHYFTKFYVDPSVEKGLRICSNGHAPLTVMPIHDKKIKTILLQNQELFK